MILENYADDFIVITDDPFPLSSRDAKLYFDITWKDKTSKLIINCRDISRKEKVDQNSTKIVSLTISEFKGMHNELSAIEPKIIPYFPKDFSFNTIIIERPNTQTSWGFFSLQPTSILEEDKEFSEESILNLQNYLRAVVEICGKDLLFNVLFNDENTSFFEDNEIFEIKRSNEKIKNSKDRCLELLKSHGKFENLQSLTEELYKEEDLSLEIFKEVCYEGFFIGHAKINEEIESLIVKIQKSLIERQNLSMGPRIIEELNKDIEELLNEYYCKQRISINLKLELSKNLVRMYSSFLKEMLNDRDQYETVIFRDCVGERLKMLSFLYHSENENVSHYQLLSHSAEEIIITRKIQLIRKWEDGQEMVKANLRHEDYSLIQLKNLNCTDIDLEKLDDFHTYMNLAYKFLINYYEARRANIANQKQVLDDPLNVIPPVRPRTKPVQKIVIKTPTEDMDMYQSIDISGIVNNEDNESGEEFQDALDEANFSHMMKSEIEKRKQKEEFQNELKKIANVKAELRNSQHQLKRQYERLKKKATDSSEDLYGSLNFSSLHPESSIKLKKQRVIPGSSLSNEERKIESRKATERIRIYNQKLRGIPEEKIKKPIKSMNRFPVQPKDKQSQLSPPCALSVPPPPPPPPPAPPPPPPPPFCPPVLNKLISIKSPFETKGPGNMKMSPIAMGGGIMNELKLKLANRSNRIEDNDIEKQLKKEKLKHNIPNSINESLSTMVDNRRQHFCDKSIEDEDKDDDDDDYDE